MSNCYECRHRVVTKRKYSPTQYHCALTMSRDEVSGRVKYDDCALTRLYGPCRFSPAQPKPTLIQRLKEVFS